MLIFEFVVYLLAIFTRTYANSTVSSRDERVTLTFKPPYLIRGLSLDIDVRCSFRLDSNSTVASVLSMVMSHSKSTGQLDFNYLASVNEFEGHAHNLTHDMSKVTGSIDNSGESFLQLTFRYPDTDLSGQYLCEISGFDHIGTPVTKYATLNLVPSNITDFFDFIENLQTCNRQQSQLIEQFRAKLYPTLTHNFYVSNLFNEHRYYLAKEMYDFTYSQRQLECESYGGYLAELDTHEEFLFVANFINLNNPPEYVYLGATDALKEGVWVNKHNNTLRPSFEWGPGEPNLLPISIIQCFVHTTQLLEASYDSYSGSRKNYVSYICEIPDGLC